MALILRISIFSMLLSIFSVASSYAAPSDEKKGGHGQHTEHPPHDHPTKNLKKTDHGTHRRKESKKLN